MKFIRLQLYFIKNFRGSLVHLDKLYKSTVSKCPVIIRIGYCQSLIYRTKEDLAKSKCTVEKRKLKRLLKATRAELLKLSTDLKNAL